MGLCGSKIAPDDPYLIETPESKEINKGIEESLQRDMEADRKIIKCLLLGAGECGKSTVLKQMKILHLNGFTPEEKQNYRGIIFKNTLESIQTLIAACDQLALPFDTEDNKLRAERLMGVSQSDRIPVHIRDDIHALWQDSGVQQALARNNEFHLLDSAPYFLSNVRRIFVEDYAPSDQDILRSRVPTTGIIQTDFFIEGMTFRFFDVGGQRGERKKWIHCFDNVTAIFFIASLAEYDQVLAEDRTRNRLKESLDLFEGIINLPWFVEAPIILFLNKNDIFRRKIAAVDIGIYYPGYTGGLNYDAGLQFIRDEYFERNDDPDKQIYCHVTDATDTKNIEFVWKAAQHMILEANLTKSPLAMV